MNHEQMRPVTGRQNFYVTSAETLLGAAALIATCCPGAILGALVASTVWSMTRATLARRALAALGSTLLLGAMYEPLVLAWPWRLAILSVGHAQGDFSPEAVVHSAAIELALGPALALMTSVGLNMRRRTVIGQVHMSARRSARRAPALQPGYRPSTASSATRDSGGGQIRLGVDQNGQTFDLDIAEISQHVFLTGGTGTGKTTTTVRIASDALASGHAVAIIDAKAGPLRQDAHRVARRHKLPFQFVQPDEDGSIGYDVCTGDAADIANKLVGVFPFSEQADIYKQVVMQALPVVVKALRAASRPVTLRELTRVFDSGFARLGRDAPAYEEDLSYLHQTQQETLARDGYSGLRFRLRAISEGKFGGILSTTPALDWDTVSSTRCVSYIGLPTTAAPEDVELFGKVIIQDLKQLCARRLRLVGEGRALRPLLVIFDEFTALREAPQIRDLLIQSRQALMPVIVCQQYLPFDQDIRASVLQSGLLICHRLGAEDAQSIADELGTRRVAFLTSQVDFDTGEVTKGSVRPVDEYRIHPNQLRGLERGQAVVFARTSQRRAIVSIRREDLG